MNLNYIQDNYLRLKNNYTQTEKQPYQKCVYILWQTKNYVWIVKDCKKVAEITILQD